MEKNLNFFNPWLTDNSKRRGVQTDFQQLNETRFVTTVTEADKVNHLVVFMTGSTPFPDGLGGAVYFSWPNDQGQNWQLLGHISNAKPSAIFKISNLKAGMMGAMGSPNANANAAQIGISVEPLDQLSQQTPAANTTASSVQTVMQLSTRMLENLYNFVSSFALTQGQMTPNPSETFVPLSSLQMWFENFKRRMEQDPNFLKS